MTPEIIQEIPTGGDPMLEAVKWIGTMALIVLAGAAPVMAYIRKANADSAANAKDEAATTLYEQLQEQIKRMSDDLRTLTGEKNRLFEEWVALKAKAEYQEKRINELAHADAVIRKLRDLLAEKEKEISTHEKENRKLMTEMLAMKDRIHTLEIRLSEDEKQFCSDCPRLKKNLKQES